MEQGTDLRAWLFTILHHQHVSHARRDARQRASIRLQKDNPGETLSPDQTVRLELRDLERAIALLPEEQRSVILFVGLNGMRYDEAAAAVNLAVGTVRSRVSRGRETLRAMTGLFPSRHSRPPKVMANPSSPQCPALSGNLFIPTRKDPTSTSRSGRSSSEDTCLSGLSRGHSGMSCNYPRGGAGTWHVAALAAACRQP